MLPKHKVKHKTKHIQCDEVPVSFVNGKCPGCGHSFAPTQLKWGMDRDLRNQLITATQFTMCQSFINQIKFNSM